MNDMDDFLGGPSPFTAAPSIYDPLRADLPRSSAPATSYSPGPAPTMPVLQCPYTASNCPILQPYSYDNDPGLPAVNVESSDAPTGRSPLPAGCPGPRSHSPNAAVRAGAAQGRPPSAGLYPAPHQQQQQPSSMDPSRLSGPTSSHSSGTAGSVNTSGTNERSNSGTSSGGSSFSYAVPYTPGYAEGDKYPSPRGQHLSLSGAEAASEDYPGAGLKQKQRSNSGTPDLEDLMENGHGHEEGEDGSTCTAFISKLYHLCSHLEYRDYIRWNTDGTAFLLAQNNTVFATSILPRFFRHSNVSSFIRQLNLYNFTRLPTIQLLEAVDTTASASPTSAFAGFSHPHFRRNDEASLRLIKPKPSKSKAARKAAAQAAAAEKSQGRTAGRKGSTARK